MAALQGAATAAACSPAQVLRPTRPAGLLSGSVVLPRGRWAAGSRASRSVCVATLSVDKSEGGIVLVDHYKRLGVPQDADNAQIMKAFEARCMELTEGGNQAMDEEAARQRLQELETSLDVLTSEEARRLYDWGVQRALRGDADDYVWPFETDVTQKNFIPLGNPPRPMTPVDEEGIANLGTFLLVWLAISAVLSCTLK